MARENSGVLDANALFGDLPFVSLQHPSSAPPPPLTDLAPMSAPVVISEMPEAPATVRRPKRVDATRARLISVIVCGSAALVAALFACALYVQSAPSAHPAPPAPAAGIAAR